MAVAFVAAATGNTGASTAGTLAVAIPGTAAAGHLLLIVGSAERSLQPTLSAPTAGLTALRNETSANVSQALYWKRLGTSDLAGNITLSVTSNRRMSLALIVLSGAENPVFVTSAFVQNGAGTTTLTCPNATPTVNDSMLVGVASTVGAVAPYDGRTYAPSGTYTERAEVTGTSTTSFNATSYAATRLLVGGSGSSQTGLVVTTSNGSDSNLPSTIVVAPSSGSDTVNAGADEVDLEPFELHDVEAQATSSGAATWSNVSGTALSLTAVPPIGTQFPGPASAAGGPALSAVIRATNGAATDDKTVTFLKATEFIRPIGGAFRPVRFSKQ